MSAPPTELRAGIVGQGREQRHRQQTERRHRQEDRHEIGGRVYRVQAGQFICVPDGLISELEAGGDFRGLIEKELKLRLDLPATEPPVSAPTNQSRATCPICKTSNEPDAKFCKSCAAKLS